jgi:hypothetical protein
MTPRLFVYAALALVTGTLWSPSRAEAMGVGSCTDPTVSISANPVAPGVLSQAALTCTTSAGVLVTLSVTDGFLVDPIDSSTTMTLAASSGAAVTWTTPASAGYYVVSCNSPSPGFASGICAKTVIASVPVGIVPPLVGGISGQIEVLVGASASFSVEASDPNVPPQPLTYAWSASGGTVAQDPQNPAAASWQAPPVPGPYTVTVTVSNGVASQSSTKTVTALLAKFQASIPVALDAPRRLCTAQDGLGGLFVVDGRQAAIGDVAYLSVRGEVRGFATLPEPAVAVSQGAGMLWVTTPNGNVFRLDAGSGRVLGKLALADAGQGLLAPFGIAYEPARNVLWITELDADRVRILRPDGTLVTMISQAGSVPLGSPIDVAVDSGGSKVWVLDKEPNAAGLFLHAYDLDGNYLGSYVGTATLSRGGGLGVGPDGRVYVTDAFQGVVEVLDRSGSVVGTVGEFGEQLGQLIAPYDVAVLVNGDIVVASPTNGRVERYGTGTPLPTTCTVNGKLDSDCDGLSDEWELAHGLNPYDPSDALAAFGNTGLNNYEVAAYQAQYGTDPWAPAVAASAPTEVAPGLVKMTATTPGSDLFTVAYSWRQVSGPTVSLAGADTAAASFIARTQGTYAFEVKGGTDLGTGPVTLVTLSVKNVPPVVDAERVVVSQPGGTVRLDGSLSSDANGDALTFEWDQTLGAPVIASAPGAGLSVRPRSPGLYKFLLTATDANGASAAAEVPVLVQLQPASTAVATASPASAAVGDSVSLDGTASLFADAAPAFHWEQIDGAPAVLLGTNQPVATFLPAAAGRYAFALTVLTGDGRRSPPARVDVFVAEAGKAPPEIQSASVEAAAVEVNKPIALTAAGTGSGFAWRQVAGPAAGLADPTAGSVSAVAFSPGWYAFEVSATDGAAVGPPVRVSFEARANGQPIPVAQLGSPNPSPVTGEIVTLDARSSIGAARYRFTQVAGPWVVLNLQGPVRTFRAHDPGTYVFELEVDDGRVRSAPARLQITVTDNGVH